EIKKFVPEDYFEVVATFGPDGAESAPPSPRTSYRGTWFRKRPSEPDDRRLPPDGKEAEAIVQRARHGSAVVESVDRQTRKLPPPFLYDLTELQRHANRLYGFTAQRTLQIAQELYERR